MQGYRVSAIVTFILTFGGIVLLCRVLQETKAKKDILEI